ncbi:MAG TPA: hypothetical protein VKS20_07690 [Candidatus Acidoferrales bacterium]|nr:hypothetical protein [Candidatus Acidoferrales bacterium]
MILSFRISTHEDDAGGYRLGQTRAARRRIGITTLAWLIPLLVISGCGFSAGSSSKPPQNVTVVVAPQNASVLLAQTVQFTATVTGANSSVVNWSVNGIAGGNSAVGAISASGLYTAPLNLPLTPAVTITATTQSAPQVSDSATVQIESGIVVNIAPNSANVPPGGSANFTAMVSGTAAANSGVSWSVNNVAGGNTTLGLLSATGTNSAKYTAPAIPPAAAVSVTATSTADPSKSAAASVSISCAAANSISPASASVAAGATQTFSASLCIAPGTPMSWDVNGVPGGSAATGLIVTSSANTAAYTAPSSAPSPNPVTIHAVAGTQSASATVTVVSATAIAVSVSPASASVAAGQRASFTASVTGTANTSVTWAVNGIANGNTTVGQACAPASNPCATPSGAETTIDYFAPQIPPQPDSVVLTATSPADPTRSASAQITIVAPAQPGVSLVPFYAFLAPSQQFQFIAAVSGSANTGLTWTVSSAVPGQGCSGASCGSIDNAGNYIAPAAAPSPNAILITATNAADPSLAATATVAVTSGPTIETLLPSSVVAGAQQNFLLAIEGLNFVATTGSGTSQLLVNNSPRTTNCPTPNRCTITLQPADVAAAGSLALQIQNPGAPGALSNPVSLIVLPAPAPPSAISLTSATPIVAGSEIVVPEPTTASATTSPVSVNFVGTVSADGSTCTIQASPVAVTRPASGSITANICVQGNFLDPTFAYAFSAPQSGGDIGISTASMASLFPNLVELTLTISNQTAAGVRTLFITTPNGDVAAATGVLEVK